MNVLAFPTNQIAVKHTSPPPSVQISDLPAGSGKTRSIIEAVVANQRPALILTPTNLLSDEYEQNFLRNGITPIVISRERNPERNSRQHLAEAIRAGKGIILVNAKVFYNSGVAPRDFDLYVDEFPDVLEIITFKKAKYIRPLLTDIIAATTLTSSPDYYEVSLSKTAYDIAENGWEHDLIKDSSPLLTLCESIASPHYRVFVIADQFKRYVAGEIETVQFWTVLQPSVFRETKPTLVGANGSNQLMHHIWSPLIDFAPARAITGDYSDLSHLGPRTKIIYLSNDNLTGTRLKQLKHQTVIDAAAELVATEYPGVPHIYGFNNNPAKHGADFSWPLDSGEKVGLMPHGQNGFRSRKLAVYLGAQYYDPATYKFLESVFGISRDEATRAFTHERVYQFVMRTAARDYRSNEHVTMIVPDIACAEFLADLFRTKNLEYRDIGIDEKAEKKPAQTAMERRSTKADWIKNKREQEKAMRDSHENTAQYGGFRLMLWANKYAQKLVADTTGSSWADVMSFLEEKHRSYTPKSKSAAVCFREGALSDTGNHKLAGNIQSTRLLILDMDEVRGDPQELSDFFYRVGWSHCIFGTYSSTPLEPRVRAVIGLSEAVNPANYAKIIKLVQADINAEFGPGVFVVDEGAMTINQKFHVPSVSEYKSSIWIKRHVAAGNELFAAKFLDVPFFLTRRLSVQPSTSLVGNGASRRSDPDTKKTVDDILDKWSVSAGVGKGSYNFHQAGVELKKAGISRDECVSILTANRFRFGHGQDRNAVAVVQSIFV